MSGVINLEEYRRKKINTQLSDKPETRFERESRLRQESIERLKEKARRYWGDDDSPEA